jgi:hypothetical protein
MQSNNLMSKNVITSFDISGDGDSAAVAIFDELIRSPSSRNSSITNQAASIDFEELQSGLIDIRAVAVAVRHIRDNGAMVIIRPSAPGQLDRATWGYWSRKNCRG